MCSDRYKDTTGTSNTLALFLGCTSSGKVRIVLVRAMVLDTKTTVVKNVEWVPAIQVIPLIGVYETP